jgi:hypothetical protein
MANPLIGSPVDLLADALADELIENLADYNDYDGWFIQGMRDWCADYYADDDYADVDSSPADDADFVELAIELAIERVEEDLSCC